jgi:hypothetical protein
MQLGYFAQNQAEYLDGEIHLTSNDGRCCCRYERMKVRDMLGSLFRGDDVEKKVKGSLWRRKKPSGFVSIIAANQCTFG